MRSFLIVFISFAIGIAAKIVFDNYLRPLPGIGDPADPAELADGLLRADIQDCVRDDSAEEQVRCSEVAFSQTAERRDLAGFKRFIDPDARFMSGQVLRGREQIVEAWQVFFQESGPAIKWRPEQVQVRAGDGLALSQGPYMIRATDDDNQVSMRVGRFHSVWQRQANGQWQVIFDTGSPGAPADEIPAILLDGGPR